jgi:hypothetical protein
MACFLRTFQRTPASTVSEQKDATMIFFINWFVPAWVGATFILMGALKLYGFVRGTVGGADKPFMTKLCGTRPTWESRSLRLGLPLLFLAIGPGNLAWSISVLLKGGGSP